VPAPASGPLSDEAVAPISGEPLSASPVPAEPAPEVEAQVKAAEVTFTFGDRRYRVRGLARNLSYELLKVNVLASRGGTFYVDTLDLYSARQRQGYVTQAAIELRLSEDVIKGDIGRVLRKLEALQEEQIRAALEPRPPDAIVIPEPERQAALELLRSPDLVARIVNDLETCGVVGEKTNKLVAYLAVTSRKLETPLAVLVQSSSAAGKSTLMDTVLSMMPEEDRVRYSAMTGQSLYYVASGSLRHKILAIAEEEGASRAAYALKLLQSEGELTIASTGKDPATGNLITQDYRVEGPTMIFTTTTALDIDEELQNRCIVLSVDESRGQTQAIHRLQRDKRTLDGFARRTLRQDLQRLHQNAQRLLRPLQVRNPYADRLSFPDAATRTRRDHEKYLTLIDVITLLHQHQREVRSTTRGGRAFDYVDTHPEDIQLANELAHDILGHSLEELPAQTRRLLALVNDYVGGECERLRIERAAFRFTRRELREAVAWGDTQLKVHLARLSELEYLIAYRSAARFSYELAYDGQGGNGKPFVPGLIDVRALECACDAGRAGKIRARSDDSDDRSAPGRGPVGHRSGGGRSENSAESPAETTAEDGFPHSGTEKHCTGPDADIVAPLDRGR
jgi:hypothetical protein